MPTDMTAGPPIGAAWAEVLDEMERRVAVAERALAGEAVQPRHFALPAGLGPLPPEYQQRAEALLAATRAAETRFEAEMAEVAAQLAAVSSAGPAAAPAERPRPAYVDRSV